MSKICNTCKLEKPLSEFGINRKIDSNNFHKGVIPQYKGDCKVCLAKKAKIYRDKHPNLWKKYKNSSGKLKSYPKEDRWLLSAIRDRVTNAKSNNKRQNRPFNIDADYMYNLWKIQQGKCALTGVDMLLQRRSPISLSIDKIIPEKGYIKGNVQWTSWASNRAKGDLDIETFCSMCQRVLEMCRDYRTVITPRNN